MANFPPFIILDHTDSTNKWISQSGILAAMMRNHPPCAPFTVVVLRPANENFRVISANENLHIATTEGLCLSYCTVARRSRFSIAAFFPDVCTVWAWLAIPCTRHHNGGSSVYLWPLNDYGRSPHVPVVHYVGSFGLNTFIIVNDEKGYSMHPRPPPHVM